MAKQAVDCRNMVRVKVWHTHTTVWLHKNYSKRILTFYTHILLLDLMYGRTMVISKALRLACININQFYPHVYPQVE